ncbi:MAG TPA: hypothetical protein VJV78_49760 [Polyangiales bacterium]|nr:hypothetical protein [Polyangiales bacterium]
MRHELRPAPLTASYEAEPAPECADAPLGYVHLPELLRGLLGALERRWTGSVVLRGPGGRPASILLCRGGHVVAGRLQGASDLFEAALSACADDAESSFASGVDLVGSGGWVQRGMVDTLSLTAAVVRGADAETCVAESIQFIGARPIIMRARVAFDRFQFSRAERAVVDILDHGPLTLLELERLSGLPRTLVERVIFTLWITRAISLAPTWLRSVSGPISRPAPALDQGRDEDQTLAMKSFVRKVGAYSERAPSNGVMGVWDSTEEAEDSGPRPEDESAEAQADEHFRVAELLLERGYPREAVFEAQRALRLCQPRPDQRALYAWALYQRSGGGPNIPDAVWEHIDMALTADPQCPNAQHYRSVLLSQAGTVRGRSSGG